MAQADIDYLESQIPQETRARLVFSCDCKLAGCFSIAQMADHLLTTHSDEFNIWFMRLMQEDLDKRREART